MKNLFTTFALLAFLAFFSTSCEAPDLESDEVEQEVYATGHGEVGDPDDDDEEEENGG